MVSSPPPMCDDQHQIETIDKTPFPNGVLQENTEE